MSILKLEEKIVKIINKTVIKHYQLHIVQINMVVMMDKNSLTYLQT